jgi:hypothetical protein
MAGATACGAAHSHVSLYTAHNCVVWAVVYMRGTCMLRMHVRTHAPPQPTPHSYVIFISMYISISICDIYSMYISMYARV